MILLQVLLFCFLSRAFATCEGECDDALYDGEHAQQQESHALLQKVNRVTKYDVPHGQQTEQLDVKQPIQKTGKDILQQMDGASMGEFEALSNRKQEASELNMTKIEEDALLQWEIPKIEIAQPQHELGRKVWGYACEYVMQKEGCWNLDDLGTCGGCPTCGGCSSYIKRPWPAWGGWWEPNLKRGAWCTAGNIKVPEHFQVNMYHLEKNGWKDSCNTNNPGTTWRQKIDTSGYHDFWNKNSWNSQRICSFKFETKPGYLCWHKKGGYREVTGPGKFIKMTQRAANRCLDVADATEKYDKQWLHLWDCREGGGNQWFQFEDDQIKLTLNPETCVAVVGESGWVNVAWKTGKMPFLKEGAKVAIWPCGYKKNSQWRFESNKFKLASNPSLCLGARNKDVMGSTLKLSSCSEALEVYMKTPKKSAQTG